MCLLSSFFVTTTKTTISLWLTEVLLMSNIVNNATLLAKKLIEARYPNSQTVDMFQYRYTGLITGMDFFGTTAAAEIVHPLYDQMADNGYLARVRDMPKVTESIDSSVTPHQVVMTRVGTSGSVDVALLEPYEPKPTGLLDMSESFGNVEIHHWNDGGFNYHKETKAAIKATSTSSGINFSVEADVAIHRFRSEKNSIEVKSFPEARKTGLAFEGITVTVEDGVWNYPEAANAAGTTIEKALAQSGVLEMGIIESMGLRVEHRAAGTSNTPYVAGTRRFLLVLPNGRTNSFLFISGYLLGEGEDYVYYSFSLADMGQAWDVYYMQPVLGTIRCPLMAGMPDQAMRRNPKVGVTRSFALSWNAPFIATIVGRLSADTELEEQLEGDVLVRYHTRAFEVTAVQGHVSKDDYREYLSTGFGVYTPKKPAEVELIMKTWQKLPELIMFTYQHVGLSTTYSLKNTRAYKDYGKSREKACKTNNFMELQYNDEYVMKTVENKITAMKNLSVIALDKAEIGVVSVKGQVAVPAVAETCQLTRVNDLQFTFASTSGKSGTKALTEQGVDEMLDLVMPCNFTGDVSIIEQVTNASLADYTAAAAGRDVSDVRLDLQGALFPGFPVWAQLDRCLTADEKVAFMCKQATDFSSFNNKLPGLLRQFMGDRLYPRMLTQFTSVAE
ncbi:putative amidohydrolase [Cystovirus CAP3]|nr:putative amidohydrolase [Cystovirus CAP3]